MRVYDAKLTYEATLFEVGSKTLCTPEQVYAYMADTLEVHPMQEVFYVILLNRKNRPLGRIAVTTGTVSSALAHPREVYRPAMWVARAVSSARTIILPVIPLPVRPICTLPGCFGKPPRRSTSSYSTTSSSVGPNAIRSVSDTSVSAVPGYFSLRGYGPFFG
jgi:hypothetical protein